jgi:hypothetical protein
MAKKRQGLSKTTEKRAFQQAGSVCAFCPEHEIASLQIHHLDGNPSNNVFENLLVVCATCHTKITRGVISEADARAKKREIAWLHAQQIAKSPTAAVNVSINDSHFRGDIAQNITKIEREFGHKTFFMPVEFFEDLVLFLKSRIDRTILGRNMASRGRPIYHSYEQHLLKQQRNTRS